jgi:Ca2+-binding EF-hand superfamily protein
MFFPNFIEEEIREMLEVADADKDGVVNIEDFTKIMGSSE